MKKTGKIFIGALSFLALAGITTSCSSDPDYDDLEIINTAEGNFDYDSEGVWTENLTQGDFIIDDYQFSHVISSGYAFGFTPSKVSDNTLHTPMYEFPYASASGGGQTGIGAQYLVACWGEFMEGADCPVSQRTLRVMNEEGDTFKPISVMVCNTSYVMYAALNGTDFTAPFKTGDYLTVTAHGVHLDGTVVDSAPFYLINVVGTDVKSCILTSWKEMDLSGLGTCTAMYFTMDCSENFKDSVYGINFPTYFCMNELRVAE